MSEKILSFSKMLQQQDERERAAESPTAAPSSLSMGTEATNASGGLPPQEMMDSSKEMVAEKQSTITPVVAEKQSTIKKAAIHQSTKQQATRHGKHRDDRSNFFARIDPEIDRRIKVFCAERELDRASFLERAAIHLIDMVAIHPEPLVAELQAHDDRRKMMVWKTLSPIINLYLQYLPDNRWKARDDREAEHYNDVDIRLVELGILHALLRTEQRKIHSFKYFVEEIEENLAVPLAGDTIDLMLRRRREQLAAKQAGNLQA